MIQTPEIKILTAKDQKQLLQNSSNNKKHKLLVLLMLDCGLRVTEAASLKIGYFDFKKHELLVPTLKKRSGNVFRSIPLTTRVLKALSSYYVTLRDRDPGAYLFPSNSTAGHISRQGVHKMIKRKSNWHAHPHMLRHTFATRIVNELNDPRIAQELLGHTSFQSTEIYLHVSEDQKRSAIKSIDKRSRMTRIKDRLFPRKNVFKLNHINRLTKIHVGREKELTQLLDLHNKKVNTILLGPQGIGKSHLLSQLQGEKILRLDDFSGVKTTVGNILIYLKGKEAALDLLTQDADINQIITRNSTNRLIDIIAKIVEPQEYTLIIDDLSNVTKSGISALDKLKNIFHVVAAARIIKIAQASFLSNFQSIKLQALKRPECTKLIYHLTRNMRDRIEDYESFKNHVYSQCNGNPLFIYELIDRFSKEVDISIELTRDIKHTGALKEIDFSVPIVICLSSLMVLRYIGGEMEDDSGAFRLFGGAFLLFALFARNIFTATKRKYV